MFELSSSNRKGEEMKKVILNFLEGNKIETIILSEDDNYILTKDGEFLKDTISSIDFIERGDKQ